MFQDFITEVELELAFQKQKHPGTEGQSIDTLYRHTGEELGEVAQAIDNVVQAAKADDDYGVSQALAEVADEAVDLAAMAYRIFQRAMETLEALGGLLPGDEEEEKVAPESLLAEIEDLSTALAKLTVKVDALQN